MPCYRPLSAFRSRAGRNYLPGDKPGYPSGAWPIVFNRMEGIVDMPVTVPCGQCIGCRLERSRQWAIRCVHEAMCHDRNCFITLTYRDEYLPRSVDLDTGEINAGNFVSLNKRDIMLFMKRIRKEFGSGIRFLQCGEYGEQYNRPHHHVLLFNFDFPDKFYWTRRGGYNIYRSSSLERLWSFGLSEIGALTFESAAYVARYITKKITGKNADPVYQGRLPEFITMSRRPGIGHEWIMRNLDVVYPVDRIYIKPGMLSRPPRYYDKIFDGVSQEDFSNLRRSRLKKALKRPVVGGERLSRIEIAVRLRLRQAPRKLESGGV